MAEVCGVVSRITNKQLNSGRTIYALFIGDDRYGMGYNQPKFGQGAEVEFDIEWNGDYANVNMDTLNIISAGNRSGGGNNGGNGGYSGNRGGNNSQNRGNYNNRGGNGGSYSGSKSGSYGGNKGSNGGAGSQVGKDEYWANKEKHDKVKDVVVTHMACRNSAIEIVSAMLEKELIPLGSKKAEQVDIVLSLVDVITDRFLTGTREYTRATLAAKTGQQVKQAAPRPAPAPEPEPEPEPEPQPEPEQNEEEQEFDDDIPF